eukprot:2161211-Amphidinium_carterae.1
MSVKIIASFLTAWMYRFHFALGIMDTCPVGVPPFRTQMPLRECLHMTIDHLRPGSSISLGDHCDLAYRLLYGLRYELPDSLTQVTEASHHHWNYGSERNRPHTSAGVLDPGYRGNTHTDLSNPLCSRVLPDLATGTHGHVGRSETFRVRNVQQCPFIFGGISAPTSKDGRGPTGGVLSN